VEWMNQHVTVRRGRQVPYHVNYFPFPSAWMLYLTRYIRNIYIIQVISTYFIPCLQALYSIRWEASECQCTFHIIFSHFPAFIMQEVFRMLEMYTS
jgi:hypothetical protein